MSRTRVRRRRVAAALTLTGFLLLVAGPARAALEGSPGPIATRQYVVQPGDTVWAIAADEAGGGDPRPLVDAIVQANDVGSELMPGQLLVIPVAG